MKLAFANIFIRDSDHNPLFFLGFDRPISLKLTTRLLLELYFSSLDLHSYIFE